MNRKVVLITGVTGGIGGSVAELFKNNGWYVIGTGRSKCDIAIDRYIVADLSNSFAASDIIGDIKEHEGRLDCIINNAALQICKPIWEMDESEWDSTMSCNLKIIYQFVKYGLELLKTTNGSIINVGSVHATNTSDKIAAYATTKAAIVGLTRNLAIELGQFGIRVNCVSPGAVDTKMLRAGLLRGHAEGNTADELVESLGSKHLLGRVGQPCEIATLIYEVANNQFINGSNLVIDGGATIKLSTE